MMVRCYHKVRDDLRVARLEVQFHRDILRRLDLTTLTALRTAPWANIVARRVRLARFEPGKRPLPHRRLLAAEVVASLGVKATNHVLAKKDRVWFQSRLRPTARHAEMLAALQAFEIELKAGSER